MPAVPTATPIGVRADDLDEIAFNADGLVAAIVQEEGTGAVLMLAWMDREALVRTLETGRTWFWSRSRHEYWCKGETSGDRQWVRAAYYDCDGDAVLVIVEQEGRGACHTGERTCFYRAFRPPEAGAFRPPEAGAFRPPGAGAFRPPEAGALGPPGAGALGPPGAGAFRPPEAGAGGPPEAGAGGG
jgi:phosphoribosyl-AMP cyclohydrolase